MPNLTSFIKPSKKTTSSNKTRKSTTRSKNGNLLSVDTYPGLSRDKSAHLGFFFRQKNGNHPTISKTISQSLIMSTSSASVSSCESPFPNTRLLIPKCNTVANFEQSQGSGANLRTKCNSEISFGPLRRARSSFSAGLASLGLARAASVVSHLSFIKSRANSSTSVSLELELCRLCLCDMPPTQMVQLKQCRCKFCYYCLQQYIMFQIIDGNVHVTCPDAHCEKDGILSQEEIESLVDAQLFDKYTRYQLNYEVDVDPNRTWCPRVNCETICDVTNSNGSTICPTCGFDFCWKCKLESHHAQTCDGYARKKFKNSTYDESLILADEENASIKRCPLCRVPIERDEGCAQMMCKRCKHVFCWYCLASLDDDFLLRHYDKGPCKNKLGHSRASVFWHRTQVVGIFAGFGLLLLVASPFLLLVAPCILCNACRGRGPSCSEEEESKISIAMPTSI